MSAFQLSREAERDLDEAWLYIARESGSFDIATRVVGSIYRRFWFLGAHPYGGRSRDDLEPGLRSFPAENYIIVYEILKHAGDEQVHILRVVHSSRDLITLFR